MSTTVSIKSRIRTREQLGSNLYDDVLDDLGAKDEAPESPVYLRLDGVATRLETVDSGGATVKVTVPREMARELGLVPLKKTGDARLPTSSDCN